jgi:hypothetical protein
MPEVGEDDQNVIFARPRGYSGANRKAVIAVAWEVTAFLREAGAPLDNNICERALKRAVLYRKNALLYKTLHGAEVGDLFMSLIHTCQLSGANSFEYLRELQRHVRDLAASPAEWMPWNYHERLSHAPPPRNIMPSGLAGKDRLRPWLGDTSKWPPNRISRT